MPLACEACVGQCLHHPLSTLMRPLTCTVHLLCAAACQLTCCGAGCHAPSCLLLPAWLQLTELEPQHAHARALAADLQAQLGTSAAHWQQVLKALKTVDPCNSSACVAGREHEVGRGRAGVQGGAGLRGGGRRGRARACSQGRGQIACWQCYRHCLPPLLCLRLLAAVNAPTAKPTLRGCTCACACASAGGVERGVAHEPRAHRAGAQPRARGHAGARVRGAAAGGGGGGGDDDDGELRKDLGHDRLPLPQRQARPAVAPHCPSRGCPC